MPVLGIVAGVLTGAPLAWAYWSDTGTVVAPPLLASGSLDLTVDGQLAGPGGETTLSDLTMTGAVPGSSDAADFTAGNAGTTPFTLAVTPTGTGELGPYLETTVFYGGVDGGTSCSGGSTTPPVLAPGASTSVCVVVTVSASAPTSAQGQSGSVTLGLTATQSEPAQAWTDTATVTGGPISTWALTDVACPAPDWGDDHILSWSAPAGSSYTVEITSSPQPSGLSSWTQARPRPGQPLTTTATSARWGISSANLLENTTFNGTWTLTATPPAPTGGWTATRTGTWQIDYDTLSSGTTACTVNP